MWVLIFLAMVLVSIASAVFLIGRFASLGFVRKLADGAAKRAYGISLFILIVLSLMMYFTMGIWNVMIIYIHIVVFMLICDLFRMLAFKKMSKAFSSTLAIVITILYMAYGSLSVYNVRETYYCLNSADIDKDFRIVGFADSHVGTTFSGKGLEKYITKINALNPDVVVIAGDFVDDDTSYEDMVDACKQLGKVESNYGVYYVFGNHDAGYYASSRGYTGEDLKRNLNNNGVIVLQDEITNVRDNIYILGREDAQNRSSMKELSDRYVNDDYILVLDHEPNDYRNEATYNADLVISGHTHGGQFFPINKAGEWLGMNDATYGHCRRDNTDFIVTSGISNWTFKFKTGCVSEYIVVDVRPE